jgi:ribose transport system permease protein
MSGLAPGRLSGLAVLGALIAVFAVWVPDTFLTKSTLTSILASQALTGVVALAVLVPLAAGVYDLSVGASMGLTSLVCGTLMTQSPHLSPALAVLAALGAGALIGAFNGGLVAGLGVNSFIATLGTSSLLIGVAALVANGRYIGPFDQSFTAVTEPTPLGIPMTAIYLLILAVLLWYALEHSPVGRRLHATGTNIDAARLAGVATRRYLFFSLVVCGLGTALAGVLLASSLNSVNETTGATYLLPAYAAAFLGTTQIKIGRFNVWGTVLAIVLLGTGIQGLQLAGAQLWVTNIFYGAALILAVSAAVIIEGRRGRRERIRAAARHGVTTTDGQAV